MRRLGLAVGLTVLLAGIMLAADWDRRVAPRPEKIPVAIVQYSSRPTLDDGVRGAREALNARGLRDGQEIALTLFNAENDIATANTIARQVSDGRFRLVITMSTPGLQTVANANRDGRAQHIFGIVTDPAGAGVGIDRADPLKHPAHLAGIGTFQPVEKTFRLLREINPALKRVGTVWCPGEACSAACMEKARRICAELGIELVEVTVDNSSGVGEAALALAGKGVEAIWIGGDNTVEVAVDVVARVAHDARLPLFTNNADHMGHGALITLGANYLEVGRRTGNLAADVLLGRNIASIAIEDVTPPQLLIDEDMLGKAPGWRIPAAVRDRADGIRRQGVLQPRGAPAADSTPRRVTIVSYSESPSAEEALAGVRRGLRETGLVLTVTEQSAQGDMATLNTIIAGVASNPPDAVITLSTPTLQAALQHLTRVPVLFTYVADPVAAGAGTSLTEHAPNVTGIYTVCDYAGVAQLVRALLPQAQTCGTLYTPGELNSVVNEQRQRAALRAAGMTFISVGVSTAAEVTDAARALVARRPDAIVQIADNLNDACFTAIGQAAAAARIPLLGVASKNIREGAVVVLARDYESSGHATGLLAGRVLRGEAPARIPFTAVQKSAMLLNLATAQALGLSIPPGLRQQASEIIG